MRPGLALLLIPVTFGLSSANAQTISGTVVGDGTALDGAIVCIADSNNVFQESTETQPDGSYVSNVLASGDYVVHTDFVPGFADEYYNDVQIFIPARRIASLTYGPIYALSAITQC